MNTKTRERSWEACVRAPLEADARRWQGAGFCTRHQGLRLALGLSRYGGFRATVMLRLSYWAHCRRIPGLATALHELNQCLHGIEITPSIPIGPGLYMPHTVGSVVTATSIGSNVELQGGITIGHRNADGFPTIEDGVVVACGARILGPITVARETTIGANAVLVKSSDPGSVMVGIPARALDKPLHGGTPPQSVVHDLAV